MIQFWFKVVPPSSSRPAPGGSGGCLLVQNGDMGLPVSNYHFIFDVLGRCQKIIVFGRLPDEPTNRTNRGVERPRVEKVTSSIRRREVSGREGSPRTIVCIAFSLCIFLAYPTVFRSYMGGKYV